MPCLGVLPLPVPQGWQTLLSDGLHFTPRGQRFVFAQLGAHPTFTDVLAGPDDFPHPNDIADHTDSRASLLAHRQAHDPGAGTDSVGL